MGLTSEQYDEIDRVTLNTTCIWRTSGSLTEASELDDVLRCAFLRQRERKHAPDVVELRASLDGRPPKRGTLPGALRQWRMAFLTAQIATADLLLEVVKNE